MMTIEQNESGLTAGQYTNITSQTERQIFKIEAHRWNLDFSSFALPYAPANGSTKYFDAISCNSQLVHFTEGVVHVFDQDGNNHASYTILDSYVDTVPPTLVEDSNSAYLYLAISAGTIRRYAFTVSLATISLAGTSDIVTGATQIVHTAATSSTRVHYIDFNDTSNLSNLQVAEWNGASWDITVSDIHWMYPVQSMDSIAVPQNNGADSIVILSQIPSNITLRVVNDKVIKSLELNAGIVSFIYKNNSWSDHFMVESVSNIRAWRFRRTVKAEVINGKIFAMVYGVDGEESYYSPLYRYYTSKDGRNWSLGIGLDITVTAGSHGAKMVFLGDYIYVFQSHQAWRSLSTLQTGSTPSSLMEDISNYVIGANITHDRAMQIDLELGNADGHFDNHPIINENNIVNIIPYVGYYVNGEALLMRVGVLEIDAIRRDTEPGKTSIKMVGRDRYSWLTDRTQSEEPHYQDGQMLGGDEYLDYTNTYYGGMRHTAPQKGVWQTQNDELVLNSNNEEGISFQTFSAYIWNGSYKTKFRLSTSSSLEYAGIVFRAIDKDNQWMAVYRQGTDTLQLIEKVNEEETVKASVGSMGWNDLNSHWLWVYFRYGRIRVYGSNDGVTWTEKISYLQYGQHDIGSSGPILLDRGYVGQVGYGYSPKDKWTLPEFSIPELQWTPFDFDTDFFDFSFTNVINPINSTSPEYTPETTYSFDIAITWNDLGEGAFTLSITVDSPVWKLVAPPNGDVLSMCFDYSSPYFVDGEGAIRAFVLTWEQTYSYSQTYWVYLVDDLQAETLTYTLMNTHPISGFDVDPIDFAVIVQSETDTDKIGYIIKRRIDPIIHYTTNYWNTSYSEVVNYEDIDARKTYAWFNSYDQFVTLVTYYNAIDDNGSKVLVYNTQNDTSVVKTTNAPNTYDMAHIAKFSNVKMYRYNDELTYPQTIFPPDHLPTVQNDPFYFSWIFSVIIDGIADSDDAKVNFYSGTLNVNTENQADISVTNKIEFYDPATIYSDLSFQPQAPIAPSDFDGDLETTVLFEYGDGTDETFTATYSYNPGTGAFTKLTGDTVPINTEYTNVKRIVCTTSWTNITYTGTIGTIACVPAQVSYESPQFWKDYVAIVGDYSDSSDDLASNYHIVKNIVDPDDVLYYNVRSIWSSRNDREIVSALCYTPQDSFINQYVAQSFDKGLSWKTTPVALSNPDPTVYGERTLLADWSANDYIAITQRTTAGSCDAIPGIEDVSSYVTSVTHNRSPVGATFCDITNYHDLYTKHIGYGYRVGGDTNAYYSSEIIMNLDDTYFIDWVQFAWLFEHDGFSGNNRKWYIELLHNGVQTKYQTDTALWTDSLGSNWQEVTTQDYSGDPSGGYFADQIRFKIDYTSKYRGGWIKIAKFYGYPTDSSGDYDNVYVSPKGKTYMLGAEVLDTIEDDQTVDKSGNLPSIWTNNWNANGMETT